jgi:hypothetical protein
MRGLYLNESACNAIGLPSSSARDISATSAGDDDGSMTRGFRCGEVGIGDRWTRGDVIEE